MNLVIFAFLDALADRRQPELEGQTLRQKYDNMPNGSELEIIFREVYRLYKIIRNASVHAQSRIQYVEDGLQIAYEFNDSSHTLNCSSAGIRHINSLIFLIARSNIELDSSKRMDEYIMCYLRYYYHIIRKEVTNYRDDIGGTLDNSISPSILSATTRYRVSAPNYHDKGAVYKFERFDPNSNPEIVMDEYFLRKDGRKFIIPGEALDHNGCIKRDDFFKWAVKDTNYLCKSEVDEIQPNY